MRVEVPTPIHFPPQVAPVFQFIGTDGGAAQAYRLDVKFTAVKRGVHLPPPTEFHQLVISQANFSTAFRANDRNLGPPTPGGRY
jgi:hypothetical protein